MWRDRRGATVAQAQLDETLMDDNGHLAGILERLRREPALRAWVLTAPTGALATLGVNLDDDALVQLLEQIDAMDKRPLPVTAHDVMTTNLITTNPGASTHEAAQLLADNRISGLPVCGPDNSIVGLLSEYDLIAKSGATVADVMTRAVTTVPETVPISHVRAVLVTQRLKRLPVVDADGRLVGIISRADLVRELAYRWSCQRCSHEVRARHAPEVCPNCGASGAFADALPLPAVAICPTCGRTLD